MEYTYKPQSGTVRDDVSTLLAKHQLLDALVETELRTAVRRALQRLPMAKVRAIVFDETLPLEREP